MNKAGETFTAGTPEELKRAAAVLLPEAKADAKLSLYVTQDTVFQNRSALKELPKGIELSVVIGDESYHILKHAEGASARLFAEVRPSLFLELAERARLTKRCGSWRVRSTAPRCACWRWSRAVRPPSHRHRASMSPPAVPPSTSSTRRACRPRWARYAARPCC